jgi:hypothetical protein
MRRIIALKKKPLKGKRDYRPRRVWSLQQKLDILIRADETSTTVAAREYDVDIRLLFQWRAHLKNGELAQRTWKAPERRKRYPLSEGDPGEADVQTALDADMEASIEADLDTKPADETSGSSCDRAFR